MAREVLIEGLKALHLEPHKDKIDAFDIYLSELIKWNKAYNLTSITDKLEIVNKHFLDSLMYLIPITSSKLDICDIGTGAGFPGMPIAIMRDDIHMTLIDSSRKKCAFLYHLRQTLRLQNVEIINKNVVQLEDLKFDFLITRATFNSILEVIKKCQRFLKKDGAIIVSKGQKGHDKIRDIPNHYAYQTIETSIPNTNIKRILYVLKPVE